MSEFDCFSLSNNLLTISQNGNKATIYNPTKLTWDILLEELDHSELHAPRDLIWVSDTRFLIANFFGHVVSEFDFLGNYVGVFAELAEPEGLAFIPASSTRGTPNMLAVTSLSSGDVYFFDLNEGLNNGNLQVEDATKSTVASEGWSTGYPVSLSYDKENEMMLASTWNNEIIRFCIPDFPCNTETEGVLAQDDVYIEDVEVTNDGHFIASCSKDYGSFDVQYSICKCPIPDTVPDTPIFLNTCKKLYLPTSDQYDIGNGYWGPGGTTIDHAKNIIYVVDKSYSRIYAFTLDTLSYLGRVEEKSGYLSMPTEVAVRPGIMASLSTCNVTSQVVTAGETFDVTFELVDSVGDVIPPYELAGSLKEVASFQARAEARIRINGDGDEIDVTVDSEPAQLDFSTGVVKLNFTFTAAATYELTVFQKITKRSLHELVNSPYEMTVVPAATDITSSEILIYKEDGEENEVVMAGERVTMGFHPMDSYGNPSGIGGSESFVCDIYSDDGGYMRLLKSVALRRVSDETEFDDDDGIRVDEDDDEYYDGDGLETMTDDGGEEDDGGEYDDDDKNYDDDDGDRRRLQLPSDASGDKEKPEGPTTPTTGVSVKGASAKGIVDVVAPFMLRTTFADATEYELNVRLASDPPGRTSKYYVDVEAADMDVANINCWVEFHKVKAEEIAILEFDSSESDLALAVRVEPLDVYGNKNYFVEELTVEIKTSATESNFYDLQPPEYTETFVIEKGVSLNAEIHFLYDGEPLIDSLVQLRVNGEPSGLISTEALLVSVLAGVATIIVIFVFYRRFVSHTDITTLKSEATEIKENIAAIGFDMFDIASDVINFTMLAQHCEDYATYYQVFLGTAGISAVLVIIINLKQIKELMTTGNAIEDSEPCISLRKELVEWKKDNSRAQLNGGEVELLEISNGKLGTQKNIQLKHKVTQMKVTGSPSTIRATLHNKKITCS
ncbi:hypothetical protein TL16_g04900 [Triparma laevis f. inornata]|uniref:Uncharacterized protein n=1 Tax=Triparma laevis f. inornata TaxID=1714386 RepID=A0A9W7ACV7_9STRA|nr:hypothetical protein TL16_g04900 [Triparma laevis f. inornata]